MILSNLTVKLKGPLWMVYDFDIENIELISKWKEDADGGSVSVENLDIFYDDLLDIFINLGAPNGTQYTVEVMGTTDEPKGRKFSYSKEFEVVKSGKLKIIISETLETLINEKDN